MNELANLWTQPDSPLRQAITAATHQIDQQLRADPFRDSESRPGGRRIFFAPPLGITFRIEAGSQMVTVLRVWLFLKSRRQ